MEHLIEFYNLYKAELFSLTWKLFPVIIGSEFIARLICAWIDVAGRRTPEQMKKWSRAIGLSCNLIQSAIFLVSSRLPWAEILNLCFFYSGFAMAIHYFIVSPIVDRFQKKKK